MTQRYKLIVNVPATHADDVRRAIGAAGAGRIPLYEFTSFSISGLGRFTPRAGANPHIGEIGRAETVEEEQIQVDVMEPDVHNVIAALNAAHPYEEIGYELYKVLSESDIPVY